MRALTTNPRSQSPLQTLIDGFFSDSLPELFETGMLPRTDVSETDDGYIVEMELPGVPRDAIEVKIEGDHMVVSGERRSDQETSGRRWHRREHRYGSFSRTIALPSDAQRENIEATHADGILTLSIPKVPAAKPLTVKVKAK
ncbi:MAG: Hsp20/alpha crystallin family protein [Planctomycetota bacterium]